MEREPAVAGTFYPRDKKKLSSAIDEYLKGAKVDAKDAKEAISYVSPHAGYIYSGKTAAYTYNALSHRKKLDETTFVVIGPNHTGEGDPLSLSGLDWNTPLGVIENDKGLTQGIAKQSKAISIEEYAHRYEHSVEVQLPFLQKIVGKPKCCFICMGDQSYGACEVLSNAIESAAKSMKRKVIIIASSDFNHYESASIAEKKDMPAIEALKGLDTQEFNELIDKLHDTACGHGPITVAAMIAKNNGATRGQLLKYSTSADTTGDYDSVVAYSSIIFS